MSINLKGLVSGKGLRMKIVTLATAVTLSGAAAIMPFAAMADHTTQHTIDTLMEQIAVLQAQIAALSPTQPAAPAGKCMFTVDLTMGSKGDEVICLQNYLTSTGHFTYSGGSTGYFGSITKSAVSAWQAANGVSPTAGYFGAISRAKYDMLVAVTPPPAGPTPPPAGPTPPPAGPTPPPPVVGSGLTVALAATQPDSTLAPALGARIAATKITLTASADGDVTVKSLNVERQGLADDSSIDTVILLDEENLQVGLSKTLNSLHQALLNEAFTVKAGTTKTVTVAFNRPAAGSNGGQTVKFAVVAVDAGTATVNGTLPIVGSSLTINETLTIGALASPARGVLDPGAARTSLEVGTKAFYSSGGRWTVGSAEPVLLEQIRWYQGGSAASGDISNVMVRVKDTDYATTASADGKYYIAKINPAVEFDKGAVIDISLKLDVDSGSDRTVDMDILKRTDVVAKGKTFGFYIIPANGTATNSSTQGEGFTKTEPYYDGYLHTIAKGSLRVERGTTVPAGNISVDVTNTALGSFGIEAKGEKVQISSFLLTFALSAGEEGTQIDNVAVYDASGAVVAGPKDVNSSEQVTFTDTWTVPVGLNQYTIKGKLTTDFEDADTLSVSVDPDGDITAKGETTGLTLTASPTTAVSAHTMTVQRASLKISVSSSPSASNVVRGVNGFLFANVQYDAGSSGEDLRITSQELTATTGGTADMDHLNTCQLFDGAVALNTGGNVVNPSSNAVGADAEMSYVLDTNLIVPKGTVKTVQAKCNISSSFVADAVISIGIADTNDDTVVTGQSTGTTVTESVTVNTGSNMTVREKGLLSVALDAASPSERLGMAGKTDVVAGIFKLSSQYEAIKLTKFGFVLASSTASTSDVIKVTFWDGATKVGESVFSGDTFLATSTLTSDFIIPVDGDKSITAKVDLVLASSLGKVAATGADSGHLVVVNYNGSASSTHSIGQSSGITLYPDAGSDTAAKGIRVVKAYPTLERLSVPTNTISNGEMDLYRFKVTAPAEGDIGLFKFTFRVSTSTSPSASTSEYKLFAFSDSGFVTPAYATNPVNQNTVDCIGFTSTKTAAAVDCKQSTQWSAAAAHLRASTTHVVIYPDPLNGTASVPAREAIQVPAGTSRYFSFKGTVTASDSGSSFNAALVGDASFFPLLNDESTSGIPRDTLSRTNRIGGGGEGAGTAGTEDGQGGSGASNFVWSPNTTTTSATTTNDWVNGYLLPGLPTTEMSQQTFSK